MKLPSAKPVSQLLSKHAPTTFRINYNTGYSTFVAQFILNDRQHPLQTFVERQFNARKREGLWWHATTGTELCKSSVIRSWCRRRLHNAFNEALATRGFDQFGRLVNADALQGPFKNLSRALKDRADFRLDGSLRFHALVPLIPAKYALVQRETMETLDILLSCYQDELTKSTILPNNIPPARSGIPVGRASTARKGPRIQQPIRSTPKKKVVKLAQW